MNQTHRLARENWRQIVDAQPVSGMTIAAYCREHQVTESAFFAWRRRLREPAKPEGLAMGSPTAPSAAGFVEVKAACELQREPDKPHKLRRESVRGSSAGEAKAQAKTRAEAKEDQGSAIEICLNGMDINGEHRRAMSLRVLRGFDRELLRELIGVLGTMEGRS